jgi:uncharacterized protein (DUF342 family)
MQIDITYTELTILFTSVKLRREELNSKTYANDRIIKVCQDDSKKAHLLALQEKYYTSKEKLDNLYFKLQEQIDQVV